MKKICAMLTVLLLVLGLLPAGVPADEGTGSPGAVDVYSLPEGTEFTLTYPDGSVVTTTDPAEAERLMNEYKLMYEAETNRNGEIEIKDLINAGELKIEEVEAPEGYIRDPETHEVGVHEGEITIVNRKRPKTEVSVEKIWDDEEDRDGIRPDSVTVHLYADGERTATAIVDPDANGDWKYTFKDLEAETPEGEPITYTISENRVKKYTTKITGDAEEGYTITNSHKPETTEILASKIWDDNDDSDGLRPDKVSLTLYADGKAVKTAEITADADGNWEGAFNNLPIYRDEGTKIRYTVRETVIPKGYTLKSTVFDGEVYIFTNAHDVPEEEREKTKISVEKVWDDEDDLDGMRPDYVTVRLYADGDEVMSRTIEPDISGGWKTTFRDIPKHNSAGDEIEYTVSETRVKGYTAEITGDAKDGFTITNRHTPETTSYTIRKVWDDNEDEDRIRPESVTVELLANGVIADTAVLSADEDGEWQITFDGLPKYRDGELIRYTANETEIPDGYELKSITTSDNVITLINGHDIPDDEEKPEKRINGRRGTVRIANRDKQFTYTVSQMIPEKAESAVYTDTLEDVLQVVSASLECGDDEVAEAEVTVDGQDVKAEIPKKALAKYEKKSVTLVIFARIREGVTDEELYERYGEDMYIPNKAIVEINGNPQATNTVYVTPPPEDDTKPEKKINDHRGTVKLAYRSRDITFTVTELVPKNAETVTFTDTIEDVLVIQKAYIEAEDTALDDFEVAIDGQKVTAELKGSDLKEVLGQHVTLTILCNFDPAVTDEQLIERYGAEMRTPNVAEVAIDGKPKVTNTVKVIPPDEEEEVTPTPTPTTTPPPSGTPTPTVTPPPSGTPTPTVTPPSGTPTPKNPPKSGSSRTGNVKTGDDNTIAPWIAVIIAAAAAIVALLVWRRKKKKD